MTDYEQTVVIRPSDECGDTESGLLFQKAAAALRGGELVAFPTETVYGLGANAFLDDAVAEIYRVKGRPQDNPLIVHLSALEDLHRVAVGVSGTALKLFQKFSPGPLTLILRRHPHVPSRVSAGRDTVAVRFPAHPLARKLISMAGVPVVAPSANLSGKPSPTRAWHVLADLEHKVPYIIDGGPCRVGLESTVLDLSGEQAAILRPGAVTAEMIEKELGVHVLGAGIPLKDSETPKAPGMKYRHYAPRAKVVILPVELTENAPFWEQMAGREGKIGLFLNSQLSSEIRSKLFQLQIVHPDLLIELFDHGAEGAAAGLFDFFRRMDEAGCSAVFVQSERESGEGAAYMNRLRKAASDETLPG